MTEAEKIKLILQALTISDNVDQAPTMWSRLKHADWEELSALAERHNVEIPFYYHLKEKRLDQALPRYVSDSLRQLYHQQSARNLSLFHGLGQVLDGLREVGLPVIVLKGAFLAAKVYANPALRGMQDLDILMPTQDISAAIDRLRDLGYRPVNPSWVDSWRCHVVLAAAEKSATLEIHWDLVRLNSHYRMPVEELWARAEQIDMAGRQVLGLCPEHLVLHLCEHSALKHMFMQGCRPLVDIDRSVRRLGDKLNWETLASLSRAWGLGKAVGLNLHICRQYLDTPVPDGALRALDCHRIDPEIERDAWRQICSGQGSPEAPPMGLYRVQAEKKISEKINLLRRYIFTLPRRPDQPASARSRLLKPYYVVRRIVYLITKYSRSLWNLVWNRQGERSHHKEKWMLVQWLHK